MKRAVAIGVILTVWFALGHAVAARQSQPAPKTPASASEGCACCGGKSGDASKGGDEKEHAENTCPHH